MLLVQEACEMASTVTQLPKPVQHATPEEGMALFDAQARQLLNISGEEFLRRWDAGEYRDIADAPGHRHIMRLAMLIPFARPTS